MMNERGSYGSNSRGAGGGGAPAWTEDQRRAFQRSVAVSAIGSVVGAVAWKRHRVWGFLLGGMAGGGVGNLVFAPPTEFPGQRTFG